MNPELGRLIVSGKRNLLKFISFYQLLRARTTFRKLHVVFGNRIKRTCRCFAFAGLPQPASDSPWTLELKQNDAKIRSEIPLLTEQDER